MEVAPGVYRLTVPLYAPPVVLDHESMVNIYLLRGRDSYMLIDSSWDTEDARRSLEQQLGEMGLGWGDISQVVYTHLHPDHSGLASRLKEFGVSRQAAHRLEIEDIRLWYYLSDEALGRIENRWNMHHGVPSEYRAEMRQVLLDMRHFAGLVVPEIALEGGETIEFDPFQLKVLLTPGHSPGHICLYEPGLKLLFCGDQLTHRFPPHIPYYSYYGEDDNPVGQYIDSLKSLEDVDVALVLPGHGKPFSGFGRRLKQIVSLVEQMQTQVLETLDGQSLTTFEVILRQNRRVEWSKLLPIEKRGHLVEAVARLQALRLDGRAEAILNDDVVSFRCKGLQSDVAP